MSKQTLHQFHLSLIPNLVTELFFFIPENKLSPDVLEKLDFLKKYNFLDKVLVFDEYEGPIYYDKGRSKKKLVMKESDLEKNIFKLLEKKSEDKAHEFNYVLNKYFEFVETMFHMIKLMYHHPIEIIKKDSNLSGIFYMQFLSYKKHFESLVKTFYENREAIPKGNFNAHQIIDTYFPDVVNNLKKKNNLNTKNVNFEKLLKSLKVNTSKKTSVNQHKASKKDRKMLITEAEAEKRLLQTFFNVG